MRTLIFLSIGLIMLIAVLVVKRLDARREKKAAATGDSESLTLSARLTQSAHVYRAAGETLSDERAYLKASISELANQCEALASREGFSSTARSTIIRLLLSLNDVVQRLTAVEGLDIPSDASESLVNNAAELIAEASAALGAIADRANDTTLRRLEADFDVLKDRLSALR